METRVRRALVLTLALCLAALAVPVLIVANVDRTSAAADLYWCDWCNNYVDDDNTPGHKVVSTSAEFMTAYNLNPTNEATANHKISLANDITLAASMSTRTASIEIDGRGHTLHMNSGSNYRSFSVGAANPTNLRAGTTYPTFHLHSLTLTHLDEDGIFGSGSSGRHYYIKVGDLTCYDTHGSGTITLPDGTVEPNTRTNSTFLFAPTKIGFYGVVRLRVGRELCREVRQVYVYPNAELYYIARTLHSYFWYQGTGNGNAFNSLNPDGTGGNGHFTIGEGAIVNLSSTYTGGTVNRSMFWSSNVSRFRMKEGSTLYAQKYTDAGVLTTTNDDFSIVIDENCTLSLVNTRARSDVLRIGRTDTDGTGNSAATGCYMTVADGVKMFLRGTNGDSANNARAGRIITVNQADAYLYIHNPKILDFQNMAETNAARVFGGVGTGNSGVRDVVRITSDPSKRFDVSLWYNGVVGFPRNMTQVPNLAYYRLDDFHLRATNRFTYTATGSDSNLNAAWNVQSGQNYRRFSSFNLDPEVEFEVPTDADKKIRARVKVSEYPNINKAIRTGFIEYIPVYAEPGQGSVSFRASDGTLDDFGLYPDFQRDAFSNPVTGHLWTEPVVLGDYGDRRTVTDEDGVDSSTEYFNVGWAVLPDTYPANRLAGFLARGLVITAKAQRHGNVSDGANGFNTGVIGPEASIVVQDATPPAPAAIREAFTGDATIHGTAGEPGATVTIYHTPGPVANGLDGKPVTANGAPIMNSGVALTTAVQPDGTWEFALPPGFALEAGDLVQVFLNDNASKAHTLCSDEYSLRTVNRQLGIAGNIREEYLDVVAAGAYVEISLVVNPNISPAVVTLALNRDNLPVAIDANGEFFFSFPAGVNFTSASEIAGITVTDMGGNRNPLVEKTFRDAIFERGTTLIVQDPIVIFHTRQVIQNPDAIDIRTMPHAGYLTFTDTGQNKPYNQAANSGVVPPAFSQMSITGVSASMTDPVTMAAVPNIVALELAVLPQYFELLGYAWSTDEQLIASAPVDTAQALELQVGDREFWITVFIAPREYNTVNFGAHAVESDFGVQPFHP